MRVQRLVAHNVHMGDPKLPKLVCASRFGSGEVHICLLWITVCYESVACEEFAVKLAVKCVHVLRLVNRGLVLIEAPTLKPRGG